MHLKTSGNNVLSWLKWLFVSHVRKDCLRARRMFFISRKDHGLKDHGYYAPCNALRTIMETVPYPFGEKQVTDPVHIQGINTRRLEAGIIVVEHPIVCLVLLIPFGHDIKKKLNKHKRDM